MFDLDQTTAAKAWQTSLSMGDVVLFRFPMTEPGNPAEVPPLRPCLVLEVERRGAAPRVVLAPGTSRQTRARSAYEVAITKPAEIAAAGLLGGYRFLAQRLLSVSLDSPHLCGRQGTNSPVIGRVNGDARDRMQQVRARLHADYDIAAERHREAAAACVVVEVRSGARRLLDAYRPA